MKHQIASFLGELAEELGWAPELDDEIRVKDETTEPAYRTDHADQRTSSPASRLARDLRQLREKLEHLSSEVTELRAQLARVRGVPTPPDALPQPPADWQSTATPPAPPQLGLASTPPESPAEPALEASANLVSAENRPWPPALFSTAIPAADPDPVDFDDGPEADSGDELGGAAADTVGIEDTEAAADVMVAATPDTETPDDPAAELTADSDVSAADASAADDLDSALELFPSEPRSKTDAAANPAS